MPSEVKDGFCGFGVAASQGQVCFQQLSTRVYGFKLSICSSRSKAKVLQFWASGLGGALNPRPYTQNPKP